MTHISAAQGSTLSSKENSNKVFSQLSPQLIEPVDLNIGSSGKKYYPYLVLINLGAVYNFISQVVADKLCLEMAETGKIKRKEEAAA